MSGRSVKKKQKSKADKEIIINSNLRFKRKWEVAILKRFLQEDDDNKVKRDVEGEVEGFMPAGKEVKSSIAIKCGDLICLVNPDFLQSSAAIVCLVDIYLSALSQRSDFFFIRPNEQKDEERIGDDIANVILESTLLSKNFLAHLEKFMSYLLYVIENNDVSGINLGETREFVETILEFIRKTRNTANNVDVFSENFIIANESNMTRLIVSEANHILNNEWMMLDSVMEKKHLLLRIGFVMEEEKSTSGLEFAGGVFSSAGADGESVPTHFQSMLLKMLKRGPEEMLQYFQSETAEHTDGRGKKIRLSKVTRAIRAKMRIKVEKKREDW